jgi:hypothetical protein
MLPRAAPRPRAGACTLESSLRCLCGSSSSPGGCWKFEKIDLPPTMLDRRFKSRHLLTQRRACCPGLPRGPEQAPAPWSPRSAACAPRIIEFSGGCWKFEKIDLPPTMLDRRFKSRHLLTQRRACCPGLPRGPEQAHAPWSPPSAACAPRIIEFSGGCWKFEKIDLHPTMLDRRFKSRHLLTQRRACCPGLPRGPEQAPAPWSPPSAACAPRIIELSRGMLKNITKSTSPRRCWTGASRAGICLPRGAHAAPGCPEAPSRRLHPGVLPPLPAHLGSSSSPVGCWKFEKIDLPPTMLDRRFKSRHLLTQRRACCPGLPRGPEQAPAPWSPPSAACAPRIIELSRGVLEIQENRPPPDDAGPALQEPASAYPETRMLPRAAPRPRAGACTLESSLRCLRTSDHRVLRGVLEIRENRPPPDDAGPALQEPASAYPEARMLPRAAPRPRAGACTLESSLRCLRGSSSSRRGCWKFERIDLPPTMLDRRFKSRHLLTQRRACCPGLPRGPEQAPAPWSPPSAACAPRIIELSHGVLEIRENRPHPTMLDRRFKSRHLLTQRRACCPGLPRGPEQAPAPWSPPSAACAPRIIELSRGVLEIQENRPPPDDARPALQEPASAYPETRMLPRAAPRPRAGACTLESSLRCLRTSDHRVLRGVLEIRENRPPPDDARPALQEPASAYPETRLLPRAAPRPRARACTLESSLRCLRGSSSSPRGCWKFERIDLPPTMLDRRFKSRHLLTQRRACCPGLPRGPEQAPAPWSPPSAACAPRIIELSRGVLEIRENRPHPTMLDRRFKSRHLLTQRRACCPGLPRGPEQAPAPWSPPSAACAPRIIELSRGVLEIRENRPPPDDARPALQEPASAYPETRMLPRAAPRPRAGACTLESSLRCLRTSDHRVLRGVLEIRENRPPPDDARPALQEPASAYPETRMLPRAAPRPRAGACTLESSLRCLRGSSSSPRGCWKFERIDLPPTMLDRRFKSRHLLTQRRACCPGLPRGPEQAPAPWSPPSAACAPRIIELSRGVLEIRENRPHPTMLDRRFKSRHLLTQRRACCPGLPRGPEQAPAPWSPPSAACAPRIIELSRGVLEIRENRPPPDDARPALQEPASAYPETRMLPRAAPRPRAGACTLESSLRCLRTSDHRVLRGVLEIRENRPPPDDARPALQEPASAYPETRMLPRAAPRPRAGACTLESSLRCLRGSSSSPRGCWKFERIDLPPTMLDRRFKSRHLLTQRRACCPGLPRGPEQAPAPWSPPSAACAPPIIELSRGVLEIRENRPHPTMLDRRFKSRHLLTQRRACCPGLPRGPEQAPAPWSPPSAACADHLALPGGVGNSRKSTFTRRCWTGASRAGICLPRGAHAAPGCPEAPSRRLHPGVLPPLPARII